MTNKRSDIDKLGDLLLACGGDIIIKAGVKLEAHIERQYMAPTLVSFGNSLEDVLEEAHAYFKTIPDVKKYMKVEADDDAK